MKELLAVLLLAALGWFGGSAYAQHVIHQTESRCMAQAHSAWVCGVEGAPSP